ncbi:hypothetical protein [Burkholderia plantarii]|uniref:hypothetical protein n=1 Tax=Burkholderia plantarii TaxID=41899 RepID=UPI0011DF65F8|nr:hypothetical protein [Burkholderia plantarii]
MAALEKRGGLDPTHRGQWEELASHDRSRVQSSHTAATSTRRYAPRYDLLHITRAEPCRERNRRAACHHVFGFLSTPGSDLVVKLQDDDSSNVTMKQSKRRKRLQPLSRLYSSRIRLAVFAIQMSVDPWLTLASNSLHPGRFDALISQRRTEGVALLHGQFIKNALFILDCSVSRTANPLSLLGNAATNELQHHPKL